MPALLGNCPRLETLVIEGLIHDVTSMCGPSLGCCPVKVMKIHGFQGTVKGMTMIKLFLDYLPCLEEMRVYVQEENDSPATELEENHGVSKRVLEMFQLYNKSSRSRCNVKLMVGDVLCV
ncbi:PREDICTED: putative F-box protein At3g58820 [Brassica oleracea var. oleracea]|nr:PREDICTED: putative F-box protein At3g58820 [Brassica oleracea var. oleracea]